MSNKAYHHGDLRNALIEAGIEVINEEGEKRFSIRKVSKLCGVSEAAPYSHFKNKEELIEAMQEHVSNQLVKRMQAIIDSYEDKTAKQLLIDLGKCYVMFFINKPQYFSFLFSHSGLHAELDLDTGTEPSFAPFELFKQTAQPVLIAYGISEQRTEDAIISSWATVHGLSAIANMKNIHYSKSWESKLDDFLSNEQS